MTNNENSVSVYDLVRWSETVLKGTIVVQDRPALAGNEIEYSDMIRRAREWCKANPINEEPMCPSEDCPMCSGEACLKCGAGCWDYDVTDCNHTSDERHHETEPTIG